MDSRERDKQIKECYKRIDESFERSRKRWEQDQKDLYDISKNLDDKINTITKRFVGTVQDFHEKTKPQ